VLAARLELHPQQQNVTMQCEAPLIHCDKTWSCRVQSARWYYCTMQCTRCGLWPVKMMSEQRSAGVLHAWRVAGFACAVGTGWGGLNYGGHLGTPPAANMKW
jgi:hypothetical protein